jgi:hypothetical protein
VQTHHRREWLLGRDTLAAESAPPVVDEVVEAPPDDGGIRVRLRRAWRTMEWAPPTSTEIGVVLKAGLAAAVAWWLAVVVTDIAEPVLASLTALITVRVSVRASARLAVQRSGAVVFGVLVAMAVGDFVDLRALSVGVLVAASLAVGQFLLLLPRPAATQVPVTVLTAVAGIDQYQGWNRVWASVLGGAVGVIIAVAAPASKMRDAKETVARLGGALGSLLESMGAGVQGEWTTADSSEWRRAGRVARERLADEASEAVGKGREAARWNLRDRRHLTDLARYEEALPRLHRTAIGVSVIARGLDDHAHLVGGAHASMPDMGALLSALARMVRAATDEVLGSVADGEGDAALAEVVRTREPCARSAVLQPELADASARSDHLTSLTWMNYTALLVQVDRIVDDLRAPARA